MRALAEIWPFRAIWLILAVLPDMNIFDRRLPFPAKPATWARVDGARTVLRRYLENVPGGRRPVSRRRGGGVRMSPGPAEPEREPTDSMGSSQR